MKTIEEETSKERTYTVTVTQSEIELLVNLLEFDVHRKLKLSKVLKPKPEFWSLTKPAQINGYELAAERSMAFAKRLEHIAAP
jgi:hypothetical protein